MSHPLVGALGPGDCYAVQSNTDPRKAYLVVHFDGIVDDDWAMRGQWRCCCRAGLEGIPCRHIEAVKANIVVAGQPSKSIRHLRAVPDRGGAA